MALALVAWCSLRNDSRCMLNLLLVQGLFSAPTLVPVRDFGGDDSFPISLGRHFGADFESRRPLTVADCGLSVQACDAAPAGRMHAGNDSPMLFFYFLIFKIRKSNFGRIAPLLWRWRLARPASYRAAAH